MRAAAVRVFFGLRLRPRGAGRAKLCAVERGKRHGGQLLVVGLCRKQGALQSLHTFALAREPALQETDQGFLLANDEPAFDLGSGHFAKRLADAGLVAVGARRRSLPAASRRRAG